MQESIIEVETLKVQNQKMLEDLTMKENQERALREKADHLERDLRKLENRVQDAESYDQSELLQKEFMNER